MNDKLRNAITLYLDILNTNDELVKRINNAVVDVNDVISKIWEIDLPYVFSGQIVGRLVETCLAKQMININGCWYKHGNENSKEKDFECIAVFSKLKSSPYLKDFLTSVDKDPEDIYNFGIELKCSGRANTPTGNKSYVMDTTSEKDKSSFYLFIRYKENKKEFNGKSYLHSIELKGAWFGFLSQSDWKTYNSGQNATVPAQTMKTNFIRFI